MLDDPPCRWRGRIASHACTLLLAALACAVPAGAAETGDVTATAGHAASAPAPVASRVPEVVDELFHARLDDPRAGIAMAERRIAAHPAPADAALRFWLYLGLTDLRGELEEPAAARADLEEARRLMAEGAVVGETPRLWFEMHAIVTDAEQLTVDQQRDRVVALQAAALAAGDQVLLCRLTDMRAFVMHAAESNKEAWSAADDAEHCAETLGDQRYAAWSLYWRATLAARVHSSTPASVYIDRALAILDRLPARQLRANLLRVMAEVATNNGDPAAAVTHLRAMVAIVRGLDNQACVGTALADIARIQLERGDARGAYASAREAATLLLPPRPLYRWVVAQSELVDAMSALHHPTLHHEIDRLRAVRGDTLTLRERAKAAYSLAHAEASLHHSDVAYRELERYVALSKEIAEREHARQLQLLAARYDLRVQDAEIRALRLSESATRLELEARDASQRALVVTIAALATCCAIAAAFGWRMLVARRRIAEMAARDELTGRPNRRAILAYAEQQLSLAERTGLPYTLAIIDIDHFKRINDSYGHPAGDQVLRSFGARIAAELRSPDMLGRYGGEEWLLVMPGTDGARVGAIFDRLRGLFAHAPIDGLPPTERVSFSMGAASRGAGRETLHNLILRADRSLYDAKEAGRDALRVAEAITPGVLPIKAAYR